MSTATQSWTEHARERIASAGHRASAPRDEVIAAIAEQGCSVNAREIGARLERRGNAVGQASIYRALELLEGLNLISRFDLGEGTARYEPVHPGGEHHHHIVCDSCGTVERFEDDALEHAIHGISDRVAFSVDAHDVTLHGTCPDCRAAAAA